MGSSESQFSTLAQYQIQNTNTNFALLSKGQPSSQKYALKTYHTSSLEEHTKRLQYLEQYKLKMKDATQIVRLVDVIQQKNQNFCTRDFKTNLIFQCSDISIESQIRERAGTTSLSTVLKRPEEYCYFSYDDICNILYTCLSALWVVKQLSSSSWNRQLKNFKTVFLTTEDILLMPDGTIKILDPHLLNFQSRYLNNNKICYSPQKMKNFLMSDDEKCSIFELGVLILKISLLESSEAINLLYCEQAIQQKLQKAKNLYSNELDQVLGINVFDILKKMIEVDRQKRFGLEQSIEYAEQMYEQLENSMMKTKAQVQINNSEDKKQLKNTNHSSSGKKYSPNLQRFYNYRDEISEKEGTKSILSPRISNFTIKQVQNEQEQQSSMLESLQVQHPQKQMGFNSSVGVAGVFKNIVLNDSYAYDPYISRDGAPTKDQEQLFTDPELLRTIKRELEDIEERKRSKLEKSHVIERKDRFLSEEQKNVPHIRNEVYLAE